jgi:hypothetical protein
LRLFELALILAALCASKNVLALQETPQSMPAKVPAFITPSDLLQRSLEELQTTLTGLRMEKWKGGSVRAEATANIASIQKDLQGTLPALIAAADAAPNSLSKMLPVSRNLDALYDVLLRVVDGARIAAPGDQVDQLVQAMANVEKGRQGLNDRLQEMAAGAEKQVVDLQAAIVKVQAAPPPVCPLPPAAKPAPAPAAKKKVVRKKPATPPPATSPPPAGTAKPNPQ